VRLWDPAGACMHGPAILVTDGEGRTTAALPVIAIGLRGWVVDCNGFGGETRLTRVAVVDGAYERAALRADEFVAFTIHGRSLSG
jgi:hypothetical protein